MGQTNDRSVTSTSSQSVIYIGRYVPPFHPSWSKLLLPSHISNGMSELRFSSLEDVEVVESYKTGSDRACPETTSHNWLRFFHSTQRFVHGLGLWMIGWPKRNCGCGCGSSKNLRKRFLTRPTPKPLFPIGQICASDRMECSLLGTLVDWLASEELRQEFKKMDCNRTNPKPLSAIGQICAQHRMEC
jgi:hypothetical protein